MQFPSFCSPKASLKQLSSWKIGGVAEFLAKPRDVGELQAILRSIPENLPVTIIGNATNILFRRYLPGVCIHLANLTAFKFQATTTRVLAGMSLARLSHLCCKVGLDASAFSGIPGTVGGALIMNAGAYGDDIWQHVAAITTIDRQGYLHHYPNPFDAGFRPAYRSLTGIADNEWFLAATLKWEPTDPAHLAQKIVELQTRRRTTQPLEYPNAGSVFRNPPQDYAARLIELAGLKGKRYGNAQISEKHANFIVNLGAATAVDVEQLIQLIITTVKEKSGIILEPEIKILGIN